MRSTLGSQRPNQSMANASQRTHMSSVRPSGDANASVRSNAQQQSIAARPASPANRPASAKASDAGARSQSQHAARSAAAAASSAPKAADPWTKVSHDDVYKRIQRTKDAIRAGLDEQGAEYDIYGNAKSKPEGLSSRLTDLRVIQAGIRNQAWAKGPSGFTELEQALQQADRHMSGTVTLDELRTVLKMQSINISEMVSIYIAQNNITEWTD
eukprot:TRINITY_DN3699_c0_g1_i3.p1 TRINITY_DN3699_c0_g1~~TRINITY_DN3699_c0_g1_i3.p1  ORF type:complete len:213 (+),score=34.83 TRINITY_DN3699_c0_g1_i3:45-683(+)